MNRKPEEKPHIQTRQHSQLLARVKPHYRQKGMRKLHYFITFRFRDFHMQILRPVKPQLLEVLCSRAVFSSNCNSIAQVRLCPAVLRYPNESNESILLNKALEELIMYLTDI